jgi:beta propeller repeat protein
MSCNTLVRVRGKNILVILILALGFLAVQTQAIVGTETNITVDQPGRNQCAPDISGDRIVWEDSDTHNVYLYDLNTGRLSSLGDQIGSYNYSNPAIYEDWIVYEACSGSLCDIYLYNASADPPISTIIASSTGGTSRENPAISGNYVVWQEKQDGLYDIYLYDILSGTSPELLTNGTEESNQMNPAISGNYVVWQDDLNSSGYHDISLYDISTGNVTNLTPETDGSNQTFPAISGNYVVWQDDRNDPSYTSDIYLYDILSRSVTNLTSGTDGFDQIRPAIDGTDVVWQDKRDGNDNIYLYNISTGTASHISDDPNSQQSPAVSGNRIVWVDLRNGNEDIFLFTIGEYLLCPLANFSTTITSGPSLLAVQFNDTSLGSSSTDVFSWDFGDEEFSNEQDPNHTYAVADTYNVTLTVSNSYCRSAVQKSVGVLPIANFTAYSASDVAPLTVQFTDTTWGNPNSWTWEFGDGSPINASQNPVHTYEAAGAYTVNLTVTNDFGTDISSREIALPIASFNASPTDGGAPLTVLFTDTSSGNPITWSWEFGDGSPVNTSQNPVHTFQKAGFYMVNLTVANDLGNDTSFQWIVAHPSGGNIFQLIIAQASDGGGWETPAPVVTTPRPTLTVPISSVIVFNTSGTLNISADGVVNESIQIDATDSVGLLYIAGGTRVTDITREPLREVRIEPVPGGAVPPLGNISHLRFEGYAYALQPEGAMFHPPIIFSMMIPEAEWNASSDYRIGWYNGSAAHWELLPTAVNDTGRVVTAEVSHFSTFALFSIVEPRNAPGENVVLEEPLHPTPTMAKSAFTFLSGMLAWVITSATSNGLLVIAGIVVIAIGIFIWWRRL